MTVRIAPTLAAMADIYRLSTDGGPESPRFTKYVELNRDGYPVAGFNPMTSSEETVKTVDALIELDAEELASETANECARDLGLRGADIGLSITVATPGMWTDRIATEIEHRIGGRRWSEILLWSGEEVDADLLRRLTRAQVVRAGWATIHQPPRTVAQLAGQEGLAGAVSRPDGDTEPAPTPDPAVAEVLATVGEDGHMATRASFLYGDEVATKMGWTPLGIGPSAGYAHSIGVALETLRSKTASKLLRSEWTPLNGTTSGEAEEGAATPGAEVGPVATPEPAPPPAAEEPAVASEPPHEPEAAIEAESQTEDSSAGAPEERTG
jgi:hypothetical protein